MVHREMSEDDRIELEKLTPVLQREFGCSGAWYEVIEEGCGLPDTGREILASAWRDMRDDMSADEFAAGFAEAFIKKAARRSDRRTAARRKFSH